MRKEYKDMANKILAMDVDTLAKMMESIAGFSCVPRKFDTANFCSNCTHCWRIYIDHYYREAYKK